MGNFSSVPQSSLATLALLFPDPALGKIEAVNQKLASTEPKTQSQKSLCQFMNCL